MECPLWRLLISSRSVNKHGHHRQFLFLIGWFKKKKSPLKPLGQMNWNFVGSILGRLSIEIAHFVSIRKQTWPPEAILVSGWSISKNLLWNCLAKWTKTWWEAPMEGSVLSFLKAEWKVSDAGSAHWCSSSCGHCIVCPLSDYPFDVFKLLYINKQKFELRTSLAY